MACPQWRLDSQAIGARNTSVPTHTHAHTSTYKDQINERQARPECTPSASDARKPDQENLGLQSASVVLSARFDSPQQNRQDVRQQGMSILHTHTQDKTTHKATSTHILINPTRTRPYQRLHYMPCRRLSMWDSEYSLSRVCVVEQISSTAW